MAGSGEHIKALVRSHGSGDDDAFYSVALQVAAQAARKGHHRLAADLKAAVDNSRVESPKKVVSIAHPRGDLSSSSPLIRWSGSKNSSFLRSLRHRCAVS